MSHSESLIENNWLRTFKHNHVGQGASSVRKKVANFVLKFGDQYCKEKRVANFVQKFGGQEGGWKSWDIRICIICTFAERQCALLVQFHHQRPAQQSSSELLSKGSSQENLGKPFLNQVGFFLTTWGRTNYMSHCKQTVAGWRVTPILSCHKVIFYIGFTEKSNIYPKDPCN